MSKWTALVEDYLQLAGQNPRSAHVASRVAGDPSLQRAVEEAADFGQQNRVFAQIAGTYEMPTVDRAASAYANRGRPTPADLDNKMRESVAGELGPYFSEAPMAQVSEAQTLLGDGGGDNLIMRLQGMAPRPEYSFSLPPNMTPQFQASDLTAGQRAAMNPPRPADPDLMESARSNFERDGDRLAAELSDLGDDIAGRTPAAAPSPQPTLDAASRNYLRQAIDRADPRGPRALDDIEVPQRSPRRSRSDTARPGSQGDRLMKAAAAAGVGYGVTQLADNMMANRRAKPPASTADLAAETSPPPSVTVQEPAPLSPRDQAQELMRDLNMRRRAAGGEVPDAAAMMREIDRLMAMSNKTMAAASRGEIATGGNDPHMQAARLMAQRNEMLRRGMPTRQAQEMMAEITRLQRLGDAQRNARQAPRRAG
jgi:hypothetical protein